MLDIITGILVIIPGILIIFRLADNNYRLGNLESENKILKDKVKELERRIDNLEVQKVSIQGALDINDVDLF
jgi:hypothetical protein